MPIKKNKTNHLKEEYLKLKRENDEAEALHVKKDQRLVILEAVSKGLRHFRVAFEKDKA